jgi:hypothetical protein
MSTRARALVGGGGHILPVRRARRLNPAAARRRHLRSYSRYSAMAISVRACAAAPGSDAAALPDHTVRPPPALSAWGAAAGAAAAADVKRPSGPQWRTRKPPAHRMRSAGRTCAVRARGAKLITGRLMTNKLSLHVDHAQPRSAAARQPGVKPAEPRALPRQSRRHGARERERLFARACVGTRAAPIPSADCQLVSADSSQDISPSSLSLCVQVNVNRPDEDVVVAAVCAPGPQRAEDDHRHEQQYVSRTLRPRPAPRRVLVIQNRERA